MVTLHQTTLRLFKPKIQGYEASFAVIGASALCCRVGKVSPFSTIPSIWKSVMTASRVARQSICAYCATQLLYFCYQTKALLSRRKTGTDRLVLELSQLQHRISKALKPGERWRASMSALSIDPKNALPYSCPVRNNRGPFYLLSEAWSEPEKGRSWLSLSINLGPWDIML